MRYGFKKGGFLRLGCTFWGQKVGFKDFEPYSGFWILVLGCLLFGLVSGLFLLRLRRREYKPRSIKLWAGIKPESGLAYKRYLRGGCRR